MIIYATIDAATNAASGFWNDVDHTPEDIPAGAIEITVEDWTAYCQDQGGKSFTTDGHLVDAPPKAPPVTLGDLALLQGRLIAEVRDHIDAATDRDEDTAPLIAYRKAVRLALDGLTDPAAFQGWPTKPW
jgi:hypothetical protein